MSDGDNALRHRITLRVSDKMKAWLDAVGSEHLRGVLEAAMNGGSQPELSTKLEAVAQDAEAVSDKPVVRAAAKAKKAAKLSDKPVEKGGPRKSAIPSNLAEQVAAIAARKEARKAAQEKMSPTMRLLSQHQK